MDFKQALARTMERVDEDSGIAMMIPLPALNSMVSLSAAEAPKTYRTILCTNGVQMGMDTFTEVQVYDTLLPLLIKNERITHLQGALLAAQTEKFLKELANS